MKRFLHRTAIATVVCAAMLAGCSKNNEPPVPVINITTQPTAPPPSALVEGSITGSLTIVATVTKVVGVTPTYQWYSNTTASNSGGTLISGATSASYTLPATLTEDTYYYFCEVGAKGAKAVRSSVVTVTVTAASTPPPPPPALTEVVVFTVTDPGGNKLVAMTPDGSVKKVVYDGTDAEYHFNRIVMHPGGKKAVVQDGDYSIYVYDLETETAVRIVEGDVAPPFTYPDEAVWHPDGETILFTERVGDEYRAISIKPDGTEKTVLTPEGWSLYCANYTPDGSKIIARENAPRLGYIATFDADGSNPVKILEAAASDTKFNCPWPVSNDRIFYYRIDDWIISLCTAGIDGSNPQTLETFDAKWEFPDYLCSNADGTLITCMLFGFDEEEFEPIQSFVVRELNGTELGETVFSSDATNYIRFKFGFMASEIFDSLPTFTD